MVKVRGLDERIRTDKGMHSSLVERRKMVPAEVGLGSLGTVGASEKCDQRGWWGLSLRYCQGSEQASCCVYGSCSSPQVVCRRKEPELRVGSKK